MVEWEDDLVHASSPLSQGSPAASPRKRPASTMEHELSPVQKRPSTSQNPTPRTAASQARLDAILRAQGQLPADPTPSTIPSGSASSSSRRIQTSRRVPGSSVSQPSTPLYRPMTPPPTVERTEPHWPPQTPPSSSRVPASSAESDVNGTRDANSSGTKTGMQNQDVLGTSLVRDGVVPVPHSLSLNWKYVGCQEQRLDADPFSSPSGSSTRSGGSEPRGAVALASADPYERSPAVRNYVDSSNRTIAYIMQLEMRLSAAEKSNDAKARKMEQLLEEIDRCVFCSFSFPSFQNVSSALRLNARIAQLEQSA